MKFLILGDLHGNKPKVYYKDFDAIIAPGDFCSNAPRKYASQALRKKLRMFHHVDPKPYNVLFRGKNNVQFTLIDQYYYGSDEFDHHKKNMVDLQFCVCNGIRALPF